MAAAAAAELPLPGWQQGPPSGWFHGEENQDDIPAPVRTIAFLPDGEEEVQDWNGDLFKLYNYYAKASGSGFVGYFLTFVIQLGILIINLFIFYNYIVFIHNDGRLADIYNRISGKVEDFFIPHDNEVSFNYLRHLY